MMSIRGYGFGELDAAPIRLYDDATHGDATAGDGVFTTDERVARRAGPNLLRLRATTVDADRKNHTTAVDVSGYVAK